MKQAKQILKAVESPKKYVATEGHMLPIHYKGSIILIGESPVEIDLSLLAYEPKIQFEQALKLKHITEYKGE